MTETRITLQNSDKPGVATRSVSFDSNGVTLRGTLNSPEGASGPLPAIVATGAWTTVKEQMPGTYARELAARGFAALTFDFTGWGESDGNRRYVEDPAVKTADIEAAVAYLASLDEVDADNITGLGICASSGYMAAAAADSSAVRRVARVAPWLHDQPMAEGIYGGTENAANLIALSEQDGAEDQVITAASATDDTSLMYQAPYYTEEDRGLILAYDNKYSLASWKPWITYDAIASADRLDKPMLMVGSPSIALPDGVPAYEARMKAPLEKVWLGEDVTQFDFYDREDAVTAAANAVAAFAKS